VTGFYLRYNNYMTKTQKIFIIIFIFLIAVFLTWELNLPKKAIDPQNCTYSIDGKNITLKDGYAEEKIYDSDSKIITQYFGNSVSSDFNNDGTIDTAFIVIQNTGGSGTFFYLTVALNNDNICKGTNAIFIGDRISPQTIELQDGKIILNYADRRIDEPMVAFTSIGVSRQFLVENNALIEVTSEESSKETSCLLSGGTISSSLCCMSASDFPSSCLIGSCGCSPDNSHQIKTCDCGDGKCFNGTQCVSVE